MVYTKTLQSELNPRQRGHFFGLVSTFVLVLTKVDPTMKKQSCKRAMVGAGSAGSIESILAVLGPFSLASAFRTTSLNSCKTLSSSKGLP